MDFPAISRREFPQLKGQVYLDSFGAPIPPVSLIQLHSSALVSTFYGNPHSGNEAAERSRKVCIELRSKVLKFLDEQIGK